MSTGKRFEDKQANNFNFFKIIKILLIPLVLFILLILIYLVITNISHSYVNTDSNIENTINSEPVYKISETTSTKESLIVKGAEYLQIIGVYINSDNPKQSSVSIRIKNTSTETHTNLELLIALLDKNNKTITTLDCKIDELASNEETITYCVLMQDLSECVNYSFSIRTN